MDNIKNIIIEQEGFTRNTVPVFDTEDVFQGYKEVRFIHKGNEYRLRMTKSGKLILTK